MKVLLVVYLLYCFLESKPAIAATVECGGFLSISEDGTGYISSPNYPASYPNSTRCIWRFQAPANFHVVVAAASMDGERRGGTCRDFVQFRSGTRTEPVLGEEFCDKGFNVTSPARWLWVQFQSDSEITNTGFQATYSTTAASTDISGVRSPVETCRSYEYECSNKECITMAYRCDGVNDCGCLAGCDEDGCGGSGLDRGEMIGIGISAGIVFFLLLFFLVTILDKKHHNVFFKKSNDKNAESARESRASLRSRLTSRANSNLGLGSRQGSTLHEYSRHNSTLGEWRMNSTLGQDKFI